MKMEPIVSSETSAIRTQTPGNYPKRNNLHLEHGESLRTRWQLLSNKMQHNTVYLNLPTAQHVSVGISTIIRSS